MAVAPTLDFRLFLQSLKRPICALPIALFVLALVGTLWSDASWGARLYAVGPVVEAAGAAAPVLSFRTLGARHVGVRRLPGLLRAADGDVLAGADVSRPHAQADGEAERGIFVKNYIDQSQEFALCAVVLAYPVVTLLRDGKIWQALLLVAIAVSFVANMAFVIVSRTALVTMPVMLAVFALMHLKWRTSVMLLVGRDRARRAGVAGIAAAAGDDGEVHAGVPSSTRSATSRHRSGCGWNSGEKSLRFLCRGADHRPRHRIDAGIVRGGRHRSATLAQGQVIGNPHNQTLNVAVQWGSIGVVILYAMWFVHLLLFRGEGLVAWIGLMVVLQNIFTSLFNSHLFDFHEGWMYVLGVGVAGGMALRAESRRSGRAIGDAVRDHDRLACCAEDELSAGEGHSFHACSSWSVRMTRLSQLTFRNFLIAMHDALATAVALLASFYLRFEGDCSYDRLPLLLRILPYFVALSVVVCYVFNLTTTKWRFISLPDALNILRTATVLTVALLVLDYIFVAPNPWQARRANVPASFSARSPSFSTGFSRCSS